MTDLHALVMVLGMALQEGALPALDQDEPLPVALGAAPPDNPAGKQAKKENQDPKPQDPVFQEPERLPKRLEEEGIPWVDFDWLELQPRVGLALFSHDYRINPSACISLVAHVPVPALSLGGNPEGEHFGLFAEVNVIPGVKRDLNPAPDHSSGTIFLATIGADYTLLRNQSLYLVVEAGVQYALYGGIADLKDGIAPVAGLAGGLYLGKGLTLTLGTEAILGDSSSRIILGSLGLLIEF